MLQKKITFILLYVIPLINFAQETTDSVQITKLLNEVNVNIWNLSNLISEKVIS